ncbi:hypothetical protein DDZ18_02085 [Marinicauda salina]|uniref:STAS/SEC14 domain-containing protein n=2 Tax=Marinicauda salina TaxID=2135793 RepID=A0A2U2BWM0_9PROT|nr:hypothetical protein DDZ18_02085 [Marinicauda salina]
MVDEADDSLDSGIRLEFDREGGFVVARVTGRRTVERGHAARTETVAFLERFDTRRVLLDLRAGDYPPDLDDSAESIIRVFRPLKGLTIALLVRPEQRDLGVVAKVVTTGNWNEMRLFEDVDSARAWLTDAP